MPLLPGKENIGHNVKEMENAGHSKDQSVAAALHEAYDKGHDQRESERREHEYRKYGR
jgi:hypothetical protein